MSEAYVPGYDTRENKRLQDQAQTFVDLLHADTAYAAGSLVLEGGCGVGAQTITLAQRSPDARFTSIDISAESIAEAKRRIDAAGLMNVELRQEVDHFTRKTFTAMIEGVREPATGAGLIEVEPFAAGIRDLHRTTAVDGTFSDTFFKGVGEKRR